MNDGWCASERRVPVGGGIYHHVPYHLVGKVRIHPFST